MTTILDYGSSNHRRYIAVAAILEEKKNGITGALIGFHALTGCDFPSCFFRKGEVFPVAGGRIRFYHGIEIPHFTESGHSRCYLLFLPAIWIPNIQYRGSKIQSLYAHVQWNSDREIC